MNNTQQPIRPEDVAGLTSLLFSGAALFSWTLAAWSLTAALNITQSFAVSSGIFSNWMVWVALGIGFRLLGKHLEKELAEREWRVPVIPDWRVPVLAVIPRRNRTVPPPDRAAAA
jgi:hypothetical protein